MWSGFEPFCADPDHFLSDARRGFYGRAWEMLLANVLLDRGFTLQRPPTDGPDIMIVGGPVSTRWPVWIEATTVELGTGENSAHRIETPIPEIEDENGNPLTENSASFVPQEEKTVLRYTSALAAKRRQLEEFRARGIVAADDQFVIALNGSQAHDYSIDDEDPDILKAVYPIGAWYVSFPKSGAPPSAGYHHRPSLTKANGADVPTTAFLTSDYQGVSALIYSQAGAWSPATLPTRIGETLTIHNREASTPLPAGFFPFGRELVGGDLPWVRHSAGSETPFR